MQVLKVALVPIEEYKALLQAKAERDKLLKVVDAHYEMLRSLGADVIEVAGELGRVLDGRCGDE